MKYDFDSEAPISSLADRWEEWMAVQAATIRSYLPSRREVPLHRPYIDYRNRISVATWLLAFGLGIALLFDIPTTVFTFFALGSPTTIYVGSTTIAAIFLSLLAAAGTESVIHVHPHFAFIRHGWGRIWIFGALPMALTIIAVFLLPLAPNPLFQVAALFMASGLLALSFFCLYATVEPGQQGFRRARFILNALAYGSALLLFLFVYQTNTRSLISGTLVAITALLLAIEILRNSTEYVRLALNYGAIVGLVLGQVTWALNYLALPGLTGGLLLLLIFYLLVGIAQQGLQERLNRRVLIEFALFSIIALTLIIVMGPGFGS